MPDITMCHGKECPFKETCYRFTAESDNPQSYFLSIPLTYKEDTDEYSCEYYWNNNEIT